MAAAEGNGCSVAAALSSLAACRGSAETIRSGADKVAGGESGSRSLPLNIVPGEAQTPAGPWDVHGQRGAESAHMLTTSP